MPKEYYCTNMIGLEQCGESDPDNFYKGRFNKCKKCRNQATKDCYQKHKEMTKDEELESRKEKLKDGKLIHDLIMKTILHANIMREGMTISDSMHSLEGNLQDYRKQNNEDVKKLYNHIQKQQNEILQLQAENQKIKQTLSLITHFLEEKFSLAFPE